MDKIQEINDVCKEVIIVLGFFSNDIIEKIPSKVLKKLNELAADSTLDFYIDKEKELIDQNISEKSKDLIALLYYSYVASEQEKDELSKIWNENEKEYQDKLKEKYDPENIFKKVVESESINSESNTNLIKYKESFFTKLKKYVFRLLNINK